MPKIKVSKRVLEQLLDAAEHFIEIEAPSCVLDRFENDNPHWSRTRECLKLYLGRELTNMEITLLSLTREYGPYPALNEEDVEELQRAFFPNGAERGEYISWEESVDLIDGLLEHSSVNV